MSVMYGGVRGEKRGIKNITDAKTGPRREVLFRIPVVYQFILVITAAAAFGDSWTRSSGCAGCRAAASRIAPGCIVKALPIAIAEAFPVCLASGTGTDIMAAASAVTAAAGASASAVAAAAGASTSAVTAAAGASASAVTAAAGAGASAVATPQSIRIHCCYSHNHIHNYNGSIHIYKI